MTDGNHRQVAPVGDDTAKSTGVRSHIADQKRVTDNY